MNLDDVWFFLSGNDQLIFDVSSAVVLSFIGRRMIPFLESSSERLGNECQGGGLNVFYFFALIMNRRGF